MRRPAPWGEIPPAPPAGRSAYHESKSNVRYVARLCIRQPRLLAAVLLCAAGIFLAGLSVGASPSILQANERKASSAPKGNWSIVESPNSRPTPTGNFGLGASCVSESDCWMVGYYDNISAYQTLIQHWDGNAWAVVNSPNTSTTQHNILRDVSCLSANDCWAVGSYYDGSFYRTLTQHWDGAAWSIVETPNTSPTQYNYLLSLACVSPSQCWAVGYYSNNDGVPQTLVQRWDGTSWSILEAPNTSQTKENVLSGVACVSSQCWAVGWSLNGTTGMYQTLIQRWDGNAWTISSSPGPLIPQNNYLNAVTCSSATDCWAVGYSDNAVVSQTLTAHWNGSSWALVNSANTSLTQANRLDSVECRSSSDCWAAGRFNNGTIDQALIQRWDGSSWAIVASADPGGGSNHELRAVTCEPGTRCWTAGFYHNGNVQQVLVSQWTGTSWTAMDVPNVNADRNNTLLGITCVSETDCWTVASYYTGAVQQTLIQHWNGNSWSIVPSPNSSATENNILYDVSCPAADDCWAIGYHDNGSVFQTSALHWDGNVWSIVTSPNSSPAQNNFLTDIHCVSSSLCWAAGYYDNGAAYQTLIERWDGNSWAVVSSPNTSATLQNRLHGITCSSANDCWAVGRYFDGVDIKTLTEHWDGNTWTIVSSPNDIDSHENILWSVACPSATSCWSVGSNGSGGDGTGQPMIQHWDGNSWSIIDSPKPTQGPFNYNFLRNITCTSAAHCVAVGYQFVNGVNQTLIEHWNGLVWNIVASANTSATESNYLFGLTCVSTFNCWSAGYYTNESGVFQTMVQHFTAPLPLLKVLSISRTTEGGFMVTGQTEPLQMIEIEASPNLLIDFESIGSAMSDESGVFQFHHNNAGLTQFYRAVYP
ncbi:MAG TPA: hypothetical protein VJ719_06410 [Chthoniobacterales bacterium]|nr:hypothetical protein [Chthoniobacterales bacterium]